MSSLLQLTPRITTSPRQTLEMGVEIAKSLSKPEVLCFSGDLGAGKTTLIKGLISELANVPINEIQSPTFVYMTPYEGAFSICHFDLYRFNSIKEFEERGFCDYLDCDHLCLFEWPDKIPQLFTEKAIHIQIRYLGENKREISVSPWNSHHA